MIGTQRDAEMVHLYERGASVKAIASRFQLTGAGVHYVLQKHQTNMREARRQRLPVFDMVALRAHGKTFKEIASQSGITAAAVLYRLNSAGITSRNVHLFNRLRGYQTTVYRQAIDEDRLQHLDAIDLAMEFPAREPSEAAL